MQPVADFEEFFQLDNPERDRTKLTDITFAFPSFSCSVNRSPHVRPPSVDFAAEIRAAALSSDPP